MKHRKENRLKKKKYHKPGYYYITLTTYFKHCLFGEIKNGQMIKNDIGKMIENIWLDIPKYYEGFGIDEFILMPNHIHGIIEILSGDEGGDSLGGKAWEPSRTNTQKISRANTRRLFPTNTRRELSLFDVMGRIKSLTANEYLKMMKLRNPDTHIGKLWHRSYYDRVIRDEEELERIREYIKVNPANWFK